MTHKVTIELTDEQFKEIPDQEEIGPRTEAYMLIFNKKQMQQIRSQLPKPQKKWRFYKGKFPTDSALRSGYWPDLEREGYALVDISNNGPNAYCFSREQFVIKLSEYLGKYLSAHVEDIQIALVNFLSQQEEK